jgi:hypothetical protein
VEAGARSTLPRSPPDRLEEASAARPPGGAAERKARRAQRPARGAGGWLPWPGNPSASTFESVIQEKTAGLYVTSPSGDVFTNPLFLFATCFPGKPRPVAPELPAVGGRSVEVWISPDPAREFHSPYTYVGNNPINAIDPDGRATYLITSYDRFLGIKYNSHSALFIENSGDPVLYDPGGSYAPVIYDPEFGRLEGGGTSGVFTGQFARFGHFVTDLFKRSEGVDVLRMETTSAQERKMADYLTSPKGPEDGGAPSSTPLLCAAHCSGALREGGVNASGVTPGGLKSEFKKEAE